MDEVANTLPLLIATFHLLRSSEKSRPLGASSAEEPDRQEFESDFKKLTQHPLANDKVVREFLEEVHKASEQIGCTGSMEACESCQALLDEHWDS